MEAASEPVPGRPTLSRAMVCDGLTSTPIGPATRGSPLACACRSAIPAFTAGVVTSEALTTTVAGSASDGNAVRICW